MDYRKAASGVLEHIGGADNIVSAAHCATRLRLVIADNTKCNKAALENSEGVKGVFEAQGQLQIIFGTGVVNKVYDELIAMGGIQAGSKEDVKAAAAQKGNPFQRFIKTLGDIFVPPPARSFIVAITISRIKLRTFLAFSLSDNSIPIFRNERKSKSPRTVVLVASLIR